MDLPAALYRIENITRELEMLRSLLGESAGEFPDWARALVDQRICLECRKAIAENELVTRGNHPVCDRRISRAIKAGLMTDRDAVQQGLRAPKVPPGPKAATNLENSKVAEFLKQRTHPRSDSPSDDSDVSPLGAKAARRALEKTARTKKKGSA